MEQPPPGTDSQAATDATKEREGLDLIITTYQRASDFLARAQTFLARDELVNGLQLGVALRMQHFPDHSKSAPYLATVEDEKELLVTAVMTPPFRILITGTQNETVEEALTLLVRDLWEQRWSVPGVIGPVFLADRFAHIWNRQTGQMTHLHTHERLFELTHVIAPPPGPGSLRLATSAELALVARWGKAFEQEALGTSPTEEQMLAWALTRIDQQEIYLWVLSDERIVSMLGTTRPLTHVISVASVYTPPEQRGQGYASRSVAALSQRLLDDGWQRCALFTNLANPTSNHIYQQIGYRPICDFNEYDFVQVKPS